MGTKHSITDKVKVEPKVGIITVYDVPELTLGQKRHIEWLEEMHAKRHRELLASMSDDERKEYYERNKMLTSFVDKTEREKVFNGVFVKQEQGPEIMAMIERAKVAYDMNKCKKCGCVHQNLLQVLLCKLRKSKTTK